LCLCLSAYLIQFADGATDEVARLRHTGIFVSSHFTDNITQITEAPATCKQINILIRDSKLDVNKTYPWHVHS